ncbi:MAG TPA: hypothetical protein VFM41_01405 [Gaiella sp.]|nr:hypothetical protein [Gaiella sp.]
MTTLIHITDSRELDRRTADGMDVALLWHPGGDFLSVVVSDVKLGRTFELVLDEHEDAMDVFTHPYAYAARRGLEFDVPTREEELVTV